MAAGSSDSGFDQVLADVGELSVDPVALATPDPLSRGKSTSKGVAAKCLTTLYHSPTAFELSVRMDKHPVECYGLLGRGGSRCFCLAQDCPIKHRGGRFKVKPDCLFIKAAATEAYCSPRASAVRLPVGQLTELLAESKPVEEWVDALMILEADEEDLMA